MALPEKPITRIEKYLSAWAGEGETPQNPITREEMYLDAIVNGGESPTTPITRVEKLYDAIAKGETDLSSPITRKEQYLYAIATGGEKPSKPITRIEMYLDEIEGGGGEKTITCRVFGNGHESYSYAIINGNKVYGEGSYTVSTGSTITFCVYGRDSTYYGEVTINGVQELYVSGKTTDTYDWKVPKGIKNIDIELSCNSGITSRNGKIHITTS